MNDEGKVEMQGGCDFSGQDFGANYPDSICIEGYLWDADSGYSQDDGWVYTSGGDMPCPMCNEAEAVTALVQEMRSRGKRMTKVQALVKVRDYVETMNDKWDPNRRWVPAEPAHE